MTLKRLYCLFVLEVGSRYVRILGITTNPDGPWTTQQRRGGMLAGASLGRGGGGEPPYLVRFDDGHTALVFPGPDAIIEHPRRKGGKGPAGG